jgi:hypothetical protein
VDDGASGEALVTLDTPRLILRQWQATDLDRYVEMFADPGGRVLHLPRPARPEGTASAGRLLAIPAGATVTFGLPGCGRADTLG